jgi:hypothetical protein
MHLKFNAHSVDVEDGRDPLYELIHHDLLVNHQCHHFFYFYDVGDVDDDDFERERVVAHIHLRTGRHQYWQSADQS